VFWHIKAIDIRYRLGAGCGARWLAFSAVAMPSAGVR
jgi:hypothetical protein